MNAVHWHLVLNHLPIMASLFGILVLAYGLWLRDKNVIRVSLGLFILAGGMIIPVYSTGHGAEEIAETLEGVTEESIERHEESAETSYYLLILLGVASLGALLWSYKVEMLSRWVLVILGVIAVVALISVAETANEGAKIKHPEIEVPSSALKGEHDHSS